MIRYVTLNSLAAPSSYQSCNGQYGMINNCLHRTAVPLMYTCCLKLWFGCSVQIICCQPVSVWDWEGDRGNHQLLMFLCMPLLQQVSAIFGVYSSASHCWNRCRYVIKFSICMQAYGDLGFNYCCLQNLIQRQPKEVKQDVTEHVQILRYIANELLIQSLHFLLYTLLLLQKLYPFLKFPSRTALSTP